MTDASPAVTAADRDAVAPRAVRALLVTVVLTAVAGNLFRAEPLQSANDRSRWCTVESLLSGNGYVIDEIDGTRGWSTIDKVRHEGHFYSTKPPMLPTLVAGVAWCVERASGLDLRDDTPTVVPWVLLFVNVVPLGVALALLGRIAERHSSRGFTPLFVVAAAGTATLLLPFSSTLNNHTVAACSLVVSLAAFDRILAGSRSFVAFAVAGFFAAFTVVNELPAASYGVAVFAVLHWKSPSRTWAAFVPAALVPLVAHFALNVVATGGVVPFYAKYGTEKYVYVHEGVPSYWANPTGIDASTESPLVYFLHCTVGHHGIYSLSPVFLLTLVGWWFTLKRARDRSERSKLLPLAAMGLGLTAIVLAFYLSRTQNYNYGGISAGLRWTIWLIPFWLVGMLPAVDRLATPRGRAVALVLLFASAFSAWTSARSPWAQPWLFDAMEQAGWIDYSEPEPTLDEPLHTLIGSLPGLRDETRPSWIRFRTTEGDGRSVWLLLFDHGLDDEGGHELRYAVSPEPLLLGRAHVVTLRPEELRGTDTPDWQRESLTHDPTIWKPRDARDGFFPFGLPEPARFRVRKIEYVRTPLRRDAFECLHCMATLDKFAGENGPTLRYYAETWLTDEVPFGTVKFATTVVNLDTGELVSKQVWTAIDASDFPTESPIVVTPSR